MQYHEGIKLIEQGKYDDAILCLQKLKNYKDAEELVNKSRELKQEQINAELYTLYIAKMDSANSIDQWQAIGELFSAISSYKDAIERANYCFTQARDLQNEKDEAERLLEKERIRKETEEKRGNLLSELDEMESIVKQNSGLGAMFGEKARKRKEALAKIEEIKKLLETL
jgi:tetratricopeptide (TPR) repeat protein